MLPRDGVCPGRSGRSSPSPRFRDGAGSLRGPSLFLSRGTHGRTRPATWAPGAGGRQLWARWVSLRWAGPGDEWKGLLSLGQSRGRSLFSQRRAVPSITPAARSRMDEVLTSWGQWLIPKIPPQQAPAENRFGFIYRTSIELRLPEAQHGTVGQRQHNLAQIWFLYFVTTAACILERVCKMRRSKKSGTVSDCDKPKT